MIESAVLLVATGFGLGWLPWAPGTFGSLIGLPLAWWLLGHPPGRRVVIMVVLLAMAVPLCHWASLWLGGRCSPDRCR
ncbi:phosphatidylglycerophosphatase A [Halomonas sp. DN3]|uniref:phosphatidylglycerophosphatase A n=1 Tax=Halomonas sp. DN3 TaxID=2953657 RepID=UPI0034606C51